MRTDDEEQVIADASVADASLRPTRRWTHQAFERACRLAGLSNVELCQELARLSGREKPIAGQTLYDWRRGVHAVPFEMFAAACMLAKADPRAVIGLDPELPENGSGHHNLQIAQKK